MQIHNTRHLIISAADYRINQMRLNALFLSEVFNDQQTMRKLIHNRSAVSEPVLKAFVNYHQHKNVAELYDDIEEATLDKNGSLRHGSSCAFYISFTKDNPKNSYLVPFQNGYSRFLKDAGGGGMQGFYPSNWLNLKLYDMPVTTLIEDRTFPQGSSKQYYQVKPIEILQETLMLEQSKLRECPQTDNKNLDLLLKNLFSTAAPQETVLGKALNLFNQDLIQAYTAHGTLTFGHFDALNLLSDKAAAALDKIDYQRQRSFYNTDFCAEILKFSYLTTFTKNKNFDKKDLDNYLLEVRSAGSWILAGHLITQKITANSDNIVSLNNNLMSLSTIRPIAENNNFPILSRYYKEDCKKISDNYINLETQIYLKSLRQNAQNR